MCDIYFAAISIVSLRCDDEMKTQVEDIALCLTNVRVHKYHHSTDGDDKHLYTCTQH